MLMMSNREVILQMKSWLCTRTGTHLAMMARLCAFIGLLGYEIGELGNRGFLTITAATADKE